MNTFKDYITEAKPNLYRNEKSGNWDKEKEVADYIGRTGHTICAIGLLDKFAKANQAKEFIFIYVGKVEKSTADAYDKENKNKGEKIVRYASRGTVAGGMMPMCILNVEKGYMRFMENIDDDPSLADDEVEWSKPEKFRYLRAIY